LNLGLAGRTGILTGPGKGMGPVIAATLAAEGVDLVLCGRDIPAIEIVATAVRAGGRKAEVVRCDVTDPDEVGAMVERALEFFSGRIDILVNAAGATGPVERSALDTQPDEFDAVIAANMRGCYLTMRAVMSAMQKQRYGKIVNIGGTWGLRGRALRMAYSASKWGLRGITKAFALEAGPYNINVNDVCPGIVEGPRFENTCRIKAERFGKTVEQVKQESAVEYALRRLSTAEDVANLVAFLCSDRSRQITGQDIPVDGGWVI
jgi:NAD(P)-dependent dehydrogenase (short-subunit alcohol dehydrogenase family)